MDPKFAGIVWTGTRLLDVREPLPAHIHASDIARGLDRTNRFGGHTRDDLPPYSVAWHSMFCEMVADEMGLPVWVRLQALLHDAPEAYLGDMITPLKVMFPGFETVEGLIWEAVAKAFDVPAKMHPAVKEIDTIALHAEAANLVTATGMAAMELPLPPEEWRSVAERWIDFALRKTGRGNFGAALFRSRLLALHDARRDELAAAGEV